MTQGELEKLAQPFADHISKLEQRIMEDIVRRIKANGFSTASADWQISRLKQLGESENDIKRWIKETLKATDEEIDKIFSDTVYEEYYRHQRAYKSAGIEQDPFEENADLQQLIKGVRDQTAGEFRNMTASLGFARAGPDGKILYDPLQEFYRDTLDAAMMDIRLGAFDYNTVLSKTINMMTKSGLRWIDYESGHRDRVDVAARRAVMTGFRQIQGKINEQVASQLHTDMFEVTWHAGARPTHQIWQGRVWSMKQLREICGLGDVTGLHGANCYHDYNAFPPGSIRTYTDAQLDEMNRQENTPKKYGGKEYTTYEALQKQRAMEREMRKTRQDINLLKHGDADQNQITLKKVKYQGQMQSYKDFSKKLELPEQWSRVYQDGLGRMKTGGNTPPEMAKVIEKAATSDIIKKKGLMKGLPGISDIKTNEDIRNLAEQFIDNLGIDRANITVSMKRVTDWGHCTFAGTTTQNVIHYSDYVLNADDGRPMTHRVKTAFHESFHLSAEGREWDGLTSSLGIREPWRSLEETFTESSAHYLLERYGVTEKIAPSYAKELATNLPRLKKLEKYSGCSTIQDFGEIAFTDRQNGAGSLWLDLSKRMEKVTLSNDYYVQYHAYINANKDDLFDMFLANMPGFEGYRRQMKDDLKSAMAKDRTLLTDNEQTVYYGIIACAMQKVGVK